MPEDNHEEKAIQLQTNLRGLISLFNSNIRECRALSERESEDLRRTQNRFAQELEQDVLAETITTSEEYLSNLERACVLIEYSNKELENLINQEDIYSDESGNRNRPRADLNTPEDPTNNMSPIGGKDVRTPH